MTTPGPAPTPKSSLARTVVWTLATLALLAGLVMVPGRRAWKEYQELPKSGREAEDSVPIGYLGLNYRRSYNDRPPVFHFEKDGRKVLFAARGDAGQSDEFYDVSEAAFPFQGLSGGFGRDSIPGIDYPILEPPTSERGRRLRSRQAVYGLVLDAGPRAYPLVLLAKIEVVNDRDGTDPFVVVFNRGHDTAQSFERRIQGREVTFGTTGYTLPTSPDGSSGKPLLYDRRTKSLWLPEDQALVCVSGASKGTSLPTWRPVEKTTWSEWVARYPKTLVLFGNDRSKPIPSE
ncbi:MAG: DUF3179 domain-containing (seleno)protein [Singulisphaera sp.]